MGVPIAMARREFTALLKKAKRAPVIITRRNVPDSVIISYDEYKRLERLQGYWEMLRIAEELRGSGLKASELYEESRSELEERY
ncbi:MAG: type II toxin-antitoxin system Phd/YefM family antitoxin [Anaerolineae bacterium]